MTNVLNEQICGTIDSTLETINLSGELKVSKEGVLTSVGGGSIYDLSKPAEPKKYIGSYNISTDATDRSKRSISINVTDVALMNKVSATITAMIIDIENKYKVE